MYVQIALAQSRDCDKRKLPDSLAITNGRKFTKLICVTHVVDGYKKTALVKFVRLCEGRSNLGVNLVCRLPFRKCCM